VAHARDPGNLPAAFNLRLQDGARAEGIAAVERQAVIKNVKDTHKFAMAREALTSRQPHRAMAHLMIDNFSLALTHGLLLLTAWRLIFRADIDREEKNIGNDPDA
jgi:hypothetical protein